MTKEEAIKMIEARLECLTRVTRGIWDECNYDLCDECELNYTQGNMGEQKEWMRMAIESLKGE